MLCVVGMPGCGKSVFLSKARDFGFPLISMGDAVRTETERRGLPPECHGEIAAALREEGGRAAVAYLVLDKIIPDCIIDGVRGMEEVEVFRNHGNVDILAIHASPQMRYERLKKRQRAGDPLTREEFRERDQRELSFGIGDVIAMADHVLINDCPKEQFEKKCTAFLIQLYEGM